MDQLQSVIAVEISLSYGPKWAFWVFCASVEVIHVVFVLSCVLTLGSCTIFPLCPLLWPRFHDLLPSAQLHMPFIHHFAYGECSVQGCHLLVVGPRSLVQLHTNWSHNHLSTTYYSTHNHNTHTTMLLQLSTHNALQINHNTQPTVLDILLCLHFPVQDFHDLLLKTLTTLTPRCFSSAIPLRSPCCSSSVTIASWCFNSCTWIVCRHLWLVVPWFQFHCMGFPL